MGAVTTYVDTNAASTGGTPPVNNAAGVSTPNIASLVTSAAGGTLAAGTYFYVITAINSAQGQFVPTQVARTFFTFLGYVADLVLATPIGDVVKGTVTIQRSGASIMSPHT